MYVSCLNPDKNHIIFMFRIPDSFHQDCITFLYGKYSELSDTLKRNILQFHNFKRDGRMYQVLYKDAKLKAQLEKEYNTIIPDNVDLYDRAEWKTEIYTDKLKD